MSILSVDNISPIGSGTSVTVNSAATLVLTNANSTGVVTATSFVGSGANLTGVLSNIVEDSSPQLGGELQSNGNNIRLADNDILYIGTDGDGTLYHNGSNTFLSENGTGELYLQGNTFVAIRSSDAGEMMGKFIRNGAVELYHDNTKKFETASHGATFFGTSFHGDNIVSAFGDSSDLQLFHNGTDSFIKDTGTGALKVCSNLFRVNNAANDEAMIKAEENAGVTLSYDASTKFETMSTGARIQGGLLFNSDTAAANTLDDYEEGSFTPQFDGLSNTPVYAARNGRYTKIGRYVHITGIIQTGGTNPTFSNTSAILTITGLPFAGTGVIYYVSLGNVSHQHWDCYGSGNNENNFTSGNADFLNCQMVHNTSTMIFMMGKGSQTRARVRNASMHNSGAIIIFELSYTV